MKTKNAAKIKVTSEFIVAMFGFPSGTKLIDIYAERNGFVGMVIEHPDLPEVSTLDPYPTITPKTTITGPKPHTYIEWDWRVDDK